MSERGRVLRPARWAGDAALLGRLYGPPGSDWDSSVLPGPIRRFVRNADITHDHSVALAVWISVGGAVASGVWFMVGAAHGVLLVAAIIAGPALVAWRWAGRRTRRIIAALPDVVDMIGRSLRSGASLTQALHEAATAAAPPIASELRVVVDAMSHGQPTSTALLRWAQRTPRAEMRIVAAALAVASRNESGTTLALAGVSQSLRDRAALSAEIRSQTSQAAASLQALVVLPLLFVALDAIGSRGTLTFLTTETLGRVCLGLAVALDLVGWMWMAAIVRRRAPQ